MLSNLCLEDLLADEKLRKREFPVAGQQTYLAHAAVCPLPARVARAIGDYLHQITQNGQDDHLHREIEAQTRVMAAKLLGATSQEIAFLSSTSAGLNLLAAGLGWREGDNLLIAEGDVSANIYPWLALQRRGVRVKMIPRHPAGEITITDVARLIDDRTRLVALSSAHFVTGAPLDVNVIGRFLRARGILFCVDALQTAGIAPLSVRYVDFLTADAHKWLLGPQGIGILYVRRECFDQFYPSLFGWKSGYDDRHYLLEQLNFPGSARRYEPGSLNVLGLAGLYAALSLILGLGVEVIGERLALLRARLWEGLEERRCEILSPAGSQLRTGITTFRPANGDSVTVFRQLDAQGVVVSLREDLARRKCLRVAPHFYNTEAEIDRLLECL